MQRILIVILFLAGSAAIMAQPEPKPARDSTAVMRITRQYTLSDDYTRIVTLDMDTLLSGFQEHKILDKQSPFYLTLGNYGLPVKEFDFFRRTCMPDEFVYRHYKPYMSHLGNKVFVDTQVPFTELIFTFGGARTEAEQTFNVRHSQNINRFLNFGVDLKIINSLGQYSYQSTDDRSFTLHSSYLGKKYKAFGSWTLNNFTGGENGGIADLSQVDVLATRDLPTNLGGLNNAETVFKYRDLLLVQKYTIGGERKESSDTIAKRKGSSLKGTFSHILSWENGKRSYSDDSPGSGFYDSIYITGVRNNVATLDSLYSRVLRNTLRFDFSGGEGKKFQLDIGVGISNELNVYSQIRPLHDTLFFADTLRWTKSSNAVLGRLSNRIGEKFMWEANGKLYFTGYKAGDFLLKGKIEKIIGSGRFLSVLYGRGSFVNNEPSFWQQSYGSNHFEWVNDFQKELRVNIGGGYKIPNANLDISADYSLITNYLYFNSNALPDQFDGPLSVISFRFKKNFRFWKFRFDNSLLLQKSSHEDILALPFLAAKSSFYFDHLFTFKATNGRLGFQIGAEGVYYTAYNASYYMPATGVFYNQNDVETGAYPYLNAFINLKLKRTRFFVSFEHVNHGLSFMPDNYQYVPGYQMPVRMFKYGISWTFYN